MLCNPDKIRQGIRLRHVFNNPEWQTQGDLASVEIEFKTNTVVKKIGRGYIISNKGDFNDDFNNNFKNN